MRRPGVFGGTCAMMLTIACAAAFAAADAGAQQATDPPDAGANARPAEAPEVQPLPQRRIVDRRTDLTRITAPIVVYPPNWPEISRRQEKYGALQRMEDEPTRQARQRFNQSVSEISFETGTTLSAALDRIRRDSGLNIVVIWPAVRQFGVTPDLEVMLPPLRNIAWRQVLELILRQVDAAVGGLARLDWAIDGGVLTISTREELSRHVSVRVYDIGDLLVPREVVGRGGVLNFGGGVGGAAGTGGGGGSLFGGGTSGGTSGGG